MCHFLREQPFLRAVYKNRPCNYYCRRAKEAFSSFTRESSRVSLLASGLRDYLVVHFFIYKTLSLSLSLALPSRIAITDFSLHFAVFFSPLILLCFVYTTPFFSFHFIIFVCCRCYARGESIHLKETNISSSICFARSLPQLPNQKYESRYALPHVLL